MDSQFEGTHLSSRSDPFPMPPLTYENNRMLAIMIRTSQDVLRDLVPEPLVANPDGQMVIYIGALNFFPAIGFSKKPRWPSITGGPAPHIRPWRRKHPKS